MRLLFAVWLALSVAGAQPAEPTGADEAAVGFAPIGAPVTDPATLEARTLALSHGLRCPVCQGLSVAASSSEAAVAMKDRVRSLVAQGYTDEQITDYFVERYGTWILLEPPKEGANWLIFAGPAGLLLLGGVALVAVGRKARPAPAPSAVRRDAYTQRVLDELER